MKRISMDEYEHLDESARKLERSGFRVHREETIVETRPDGSAVVRVRIVASRRGFRSPPQVDVLVHVPVPEPDSPPPGWDSVEGGATSPA